MLPYQNLSLEDMPNEIWQVIPNYEGYYQISNYGRVKALQRNVLCRAGHYRCIKQHILKQSFIKGRKYLSINASANGRKERIYLHRIVAQLFVANPKNKPCVDHINTNTLDNRVSNLRWVTHHENNCNPLTLEHFSKAKSGKKSNFYGKVFGAKPIICTLPDGRERSYSSIMEACREGFTYRSIQYCLYGQYKQHKGCQFRYG